MNQDLEMVVGLEMHLQLKTSSKMFCSCSTEFAAPANTNTCPICLGWPGTLPSLNQRAVLYGLQGALALNCEINLESWFDRKNYFYPDLPKGYQITQYQKPLGYNGTFRMKKKNFAIQRVHLEEDAGKINYNNGNMEIDFNRAGITLLEIVTEPVISSPEEARSFLRELRLLFLYMEISDCNMEEGSLRCDANISLRKVGEELSPNQVELKNMNSFQSIARALEYEGKRQSKILSEGELIKRETRGWDEREQKTYFLRSKEQGFDYRYFPEPDLPRILLEQEFVNSVGNNLPQAPGERQKKWMEEWGIGDEEAAVLIAQKPRAEFFEKTACLAHPQEVAKWIKENLLQFDFPRETPPEYLAEIINRVEEGELSSTQGKEVLQLVLETGKKPGEIIREKGWKQVSDEVYINQIVEKVLEENPEVVQDYFSGKEKAIQNLIGQAMKISKGQANPQLVGDLMARKLKEREKNG